MYAYRKQPDGRASDLRFVRPDYQPQPGEQTGEGDVLPDIETLHTPEYVQARDAAKAAQETRDASFASAVDADPTLQTFKTMTRQEFNTWFDANVTNAQQATTVLKRLCWLVLRNLR